MFASHFARVKAEKKKKVPAPASSASVDGGRNKLQRSSASKTKRHRRRQEAGGDKDANDTSLRKESKSERPNKRRPEDEAGQSASSSAANNPRKRRRGHQRDRGGGPRLRRFRPTQEALDLSRQLLDLSRQKRSSDLIKLYWKKEHESIRDNHHACIVVDCCSRCGEVMAAEQVVDRLPKAAVSIETRTALLKCYVHAGHLDKAMDLFRQMCSKRQNQTSTASRNQQPQKPNVRTLNTLLRGCLWTAATEVKSTNGETTGVVAGGVVSSEEAWSLYKNLHQGAEDIVDTSSYEATIILLCQALRVDEAQERIQELQEQYGIKCKGKAAVKGGDQMSLETCGISFLSLAKAWALLGRTNDMWIACQRCLHAIQASLSKLQEDSSTATTTSNDVQPAKSVQSKDHRGGGKRGWKVDSSSEEGQKRAASNLAYRRHRLAEVENEARALLKRRNSAKEISASVLGDRLQTKLLYFGGGATRISDTLDSRAERASCCAAWHSFGLEGMAEKVSKISRERVERQTPLTMEGLVHVAKIFDSERNPIDVEIGSGFGDWIVRQALAFPYRNHIAVELRSDRVYQIFARGTLMGTTPLDNLCTVGSDGGTFLRDRLAQGSVANVFVNHPEPPTQTFGQNIADLQGLMAGTSTEPVHMLNSATLGWAADALEKGGRIVIVMDNRNFANLLCATFVRLVRQQKGKLKSLEPVAAKRMKLKQIETFPEDVFLYEGQPSEQLGHARDEMLAGQSYFDRLWKSGAGSHADATRRFLVVMYKR